MSIVAADANTIRVRLYEIFAETLSIDPREIDGQRPFFEMATSSLALVTALQRVSEEFAVRPSLRRVFEEFGTLDRLAGYMAELAASASPAARPAAAHAEPSTTVRLDLTSAQQELVFLSDLRPQGAPAWHETVAIELDGTLRLDALHAAAAALTRCHDALRARVSDDRAALAFDADRARLQPRVVDLAATTDEERVTRAIAWLSEPAPLVLQEALFRLDVARFPTFPDRHLLRLTAHGLIADRASMIRLAEDLAALYVTACAGDAGELAPAPASFAAHQKAELALAADPRRDEWMAFWRSTLASAPIVDLPGDLPRPTIKQYGGDRVVLPLAAETVHRARQDRGALGAFLHVVAAVAAWTARLTAQDDLVLGVFSQPLADAVVANRTNPLPLRLTAGDATTFAEVKRAASTAFFDAVDHGALPFAEIVRTVKLDRDQGRSPLFTIAIDREVWPALAFGPRLAGRIVTAPARHARYDLAVTLVEGPDFVHLRCDYSTEVFSRSTIRRYLGYLRKVIDAGAAEPATAIGALPLLTPDDRTRIVDEWNRTGAPFPDDEPLFARLDRIAAASPDRIAVVDDDRRFSYGELVAAANRVAARLISIGVAPGSRVAVLMARSFETVAAMLGVLKAGAAYVPLDPAYPAARLRYILADSQAQALVCDGDAPSDTGFTGAVLRLSRGLAELAQEPAAAPARRVSGSSLAYVIYTSGSTGQPKGVAVEHRSVVNLLTWSRAFYSDEELAGVLASVSFSFDPSVFDLFAPLSWGGAVILVNNLLELPSLPARDRVTLISSVPSTLRQLLEIAELPRSVRAVNVGGEPMTADLVDRLHATGHVQRVLNVYGPTEATVCTTVATLEPSAGRPPAIGRPIANARVYILDRGGMPVPPGVPGELCIGGRGLARGYLGDAAAGDRAFVADPFVADGRMYRTGDLARYREDGTIEFLGRRDQQVKVRGYRIELGEVEACLLAHPAVRDAVVLAAGAANERRLVAWVVLDAEAAASIAQIRAHLSAQLPVHMVPSALIEVAALPRLPNGKVDRPALPEPDAGRDGRVATPFVEPATDLERALAVIWQGQLHLERVGRDDNFFELGGHSLLIAPIMSEIAQRFEVRMTLAEFFDAPTIARLADRITTLARERVPSMSRRRRLPRTGPEVDAHFAALRADAVLDPRLDLGGRTVRGGVPSHIFLTGATGFLGTYTLSELLRRSRAHISCLTRCTTPEDGRRRIVAAMQRHDVWDPAFEERFTVVPGELAPARFGIADREYARLAEECDAVMHVAAQVNFIYPYRALKPANVDGAHHAIRLSFDGTPKPLHYVSTAAVWPMGANFLFREHDDLNHGVRLNIGYDDSKWVAELLVQQARERGLPSTIYRPGEIAGHSVTGRCALEHFMWAIVKGSLQLGMFPEMKSKLDLGPIDYVAAAIAALALDPAALGGIYHLTNPHPGEPDEIFRVVRDYGYEFTIHNTDEWIDTLLARPDLTENALYPFVAILEEFGEENFQLPSCDSTHARAALRRTDVTCPPVGEALIRRYLDYLLGIGFLPQPARQMT